LKKFTAVSRGSGRIPRPRLREEGEEGEEGEIDGVVAATLTGEPVCWKVDAGIAWVLALVPG
jgi:hypothetical protein